MNYIDLIVLLVLAYAIFNGWRQGAIVQLCSIVGVVIGIWLGIHCGTAVGEFLQIGGGYASVGGFLVVLVVALIAVAVVSRLLKKIFTFVGLGVLDLFLGIVLSACKYMLILSVLFGAFDALNGGMDMVDKKTLANSKFYRPVISLSSAVFPAIDEAQKLLDETQKQMTRELKKLQ